MILSQLYKSFLDMGQNAVVHRLAKKKIKINREKQLSCCHVGPFRLPVLADDFHFGRRAVYAPQQLQWACLCLLSSTLI